VLIRQLPAHSATLISKNGADALWGLQEQLLAAIADTLQIANWQRAAAGSKPGQTPPRPEPIKRPGVKEDGKQIGGKTSISIAEMRRRMERLNGRRRR